MAHRSIFTSFGSSDCPFRVPDQNARATNVRNASSHRSDGSYDVFAPVFTPRTTPGISPQESVAPVSDNGLEQTNSPIQHTTASVSAAGPPKALTVEEQFQILKSRIPYVGTDAKHDGQIRHLLVNLRVLFNDKIPDMHFITGRATEKHQYGTKDVRYAAIITKDGKGTVTTLLSSGKMNADSTMAVHFQPSRIVEYLIHASEWKIHAAIGNTGDQYGW